MSVGAEGTAAGTEVEVRLANGFAGPVYLSRCDDRIGIGVEVRRGGAWETASSAVLLCQDIYDQSPLQIDAGKEVETLVLLRSPGTYRLRVPYAMDAPDALTEVARSETFQVTAP